MDSTDWNKAHPIGTKVVLRLANGKRIVTRTTSESATWGGMAHVKVKTIAQGYVPLSWVRPFFQGGIAVHPSVAKASRGPARTPARPPPARADPIDALDRRGR